MKECVGFSSKWLADSDLCGGRCSFHLCSTFRLALPTYVTPQVYKPSYTLHAGWVFRSFNVQWEQSFWGHLFDVVYHLCCVTCVLEILCLNTNCIQWRVLKWNANKGQFTLANYNTKTCITDIIGLDVFLFFYFIYRFLLFNCVIS